jgi:hypothetical protein
MARYDSGPTWRAGDVARMGAFPVQKRFRLALFD